MKFSFIRCLLLGLATRTTFAFHTHTPSFLPTSSSRLHSTATREDLLTNTVPVLKEMLRERGAKVSGRKSELVDRLLAGMDDVAVSDAPAPVFTSSTTSEGVPVPPVIAEEEDEEEDIEIPTLSPSNQKILRKFVSRLRARRSLPLNFFSSSPSSIDPAALSALDKMLEENELVEARAIMKGEGQKEVKDAVFFIAVTLQVAVVEVRTRR